MKKKITLVLTVTSLAIGLLAGCGGSSNNVVQNTEVVTKAATNTTEAVTTEQATTLEETKEQATEKVTETTQEETQAPHSHTYMEAITAEATCETEGIKTYSCECGDSYTEVIATMGHSFENYKSNNDATYTADGTETAKCSNCDVTDTRTAEGSMLTYTYTDMDATMYAQKTVNVRSLPNTDGEKLGSLSTNDEVKVIGQCTETSWYRIEYNGGVAYVSDSYLGNDKIVVQTEAPKQTQSEMPTYTTYADVKAYAISLGYPIGTAVDNGDGTCTGYSLIILTPDGKLSNDGYGDYKAAAEDDYIARNTYAPSILGATLDHRMHTSYPGNITIAGAGNGYTWSVCREIIWFTAN